MSYEGVRWRLTRFREGGSLLIRLKDLTPKEAEHFAEFACGMPADSRTWYSAKLVNTPDGGALLLERQP